MGNAPDLSIENSYGGTVVGIDEAGRGPWAGPVVAAAVILDAQNIPSGIDDSKQLSKAQREILFDQLMFWSHAAIGMASVEEIDQLNILGATKLAMQRAYARLNVKADVALVDGNQPPILPCNTVALVKGDSISLTIAAASIVAKVTRDRMMEALARQHPGYGWERNAGYGTRQHQLAMLQLGVTPHHRRSFAPVRHFVQQFTDVA